ncbi:myosin light chain kinase, smooth muscle-like isoform X2 [Ctenocephalides felis]|nr:myosin light chain kinase, smooth muscle-like isoform X2 [Ctenocephalides felis]
MIRVDESDPVGEVEPVFPYRDVTIRRGEKISDYYDLGSEIGRGKFGTVYNCKEKKSGLELAAKTIPVQRKEDRRNVEREVKIMTLLHHPRLIQLYDAFDDGGSMCVILELIQGGELFERVIDEDFLLTEKSCTVFVRQICEGIQYVHSQNVLHLDLKPENILCLTKTGNRIKIIDFGLARLYDPSKKLQVLFGTPEFVAPEVVNFDRITFATDMWSVGVICYVLLSGLSPFMGETDIETMANVTIANYDFEDEAFNEISPDARDFIAKLLVKDQEARLTAADCLAHPWLERKTPPQTDNEIKINGTNTESKSKPEVPKKPVLIPKISTTEDNLDLTKENLKSFVERWRDHPNSPYLFESKDSGIQLSVSQHSLRGYSPSPCGSLNSSPEIYEEDDHELEDNTLGFKSFERRASDSTCVVRKSDSSRNVNLVDEIRKLSDRLFVMSKMSQELDYEKRSTPRPKQKFTSLSRDVPRSVPGSFNEESFETKDCLLRLLGEWECNNHVPSCGSRHKSFSVEWSESDTVCHESISSISTFYQSKTVENQTIETKVSSRSIRK